MLLTLLAELPGEPAESKSPSEDSPDPPPAWLGLTADEGLFSELEEMRRRHTQAAENQRALRARSVGKQK